MTHGQVVFFSLMRIYDEHLAPQQTGQDIWDSLPLGSWCASMFRSLNINPGHNPQLRIFVIKDEMFTSQGAPSTRTALQGWEFSFF